MNRCSGYTKNNIKCRAKTKDNKLFCCDNHEPLNKELINNCCFMCMEKVVKSNDIIFFQCKHAFHKSCYLEWLTFSKYEDKICIICRKNVLPSKITESKKKLVDTFKIKNISTILYGDIYDSVSYNTGNVGYTGPISYNVGNTGPIPYNIGYTGPISYNIGYTGPISYNIGYTGPISYNIGYTGPIPYNTGNVGYTGPIPYNTGNTGNTSPIPYNTENTGNTSPIPYNNIQNETINYIIPNIIIPTEIILNIDEDY